MDTNQLFYSRYSCRHFDPSKAVSDSDIKRILQVAHLAPSACNLQPYHLYVVRGDSLAKLEEVRSWYDSPVMILGCATSDSGWVRASDNRAFNMVDLGIVFDHMMLKAASLGLNSCIIASYDINLVKQILKLPEDHMPIVSLMLGYALEGDKPSAQHILRKEDQEMISFLD